MLYLAKQFPVMWWCCHGNEQWVMTAGQTAVRCNRVTAVGSEQAMKVYVRCSCLYAPGAAAVAPRSMGAYGGGGASASPWGLDPDASPADEQGTGLAWAWHWSWLDTLAWAAAEVQGCRSLPEASEESSSLCNCRRHNQVSWLRHPESVAAWGDAAHAVPNF